MKPERKSVACEFKARKTPGEFEADFSVYGNVDLDGDRILKDALSPAIEDNPNPAIIWTHLWEIPPIGETLEAKSTENGGNAVGRLFLDEHEVAKQVWAGVKSGALKEYSFAFGNAISALAELKDGEVTSRSDGKVREISVIKELYEWGPTLKGANSATGTRDITKSAMKILGLSPETAKAYGDIDSWEITCLTNMIDYGTSFIVSEDDPDDVATMKGIIAEVLGLLTKEMGEEPDDAVVTQYLNNLARTLKTNGLARKYGARNSADDTGRLQTIHDLVKEMGVTCSDGTTAGSLAPGNDDGSDKNAPDQAEVAALFGERPMLHLHSSPVNP